MPPGGIRNSPSITRRALLSGTALAASTQLTGCTDAAARASTWNDRRKLRDAHAGPVSVLPRLVRITQDHRKGARETATDRVRTYGGHITAVIPGVGVPPRVQACYENQQVTNLAG